MRVVVVGATGNTGTALIEALSGDPEIASIVGVARRVPELRPAKVEWRRADIGDADLVSLFEGADRVVHLAWLIQPSRDEPLLRAVNVDGSRRVFDAVAEAGVPAVVYASSVGAYSPGAKDVAVDESWPTEGVRSSFYARHKAQVERLLDEFEAEHPGIRSVRLRPGLIFRRSAATGIRRLFLGPWFPGGLLRPELIPFVPSLDRLRFQAVHSEDVAEAYRLAIHADVHGAFNIAADPVIDSELLAEVFEARPVPMTSRALRYGAGLTWRLRLQPSPPGWIDLAVGVPIMDIGRARAELRWTPRVDAVDALKELVAGLREGAGYPTPPLARETSGPLRIREIASGLGARA